MYLDDDTTGQQECELVLTDLFDSVGLSAGVEPSIEGVDVAISASAILVIVLGLGRLHESLRQRM